MSGEPENLGGIVLRISEIATNGAGVGNNAIQLEAAFEDAPLEITQIVEGFHPHGDLLDPLRVLQRGTTVDQGDLMVAGFGIRAVKGTQRADFSQGHAHEILVKIHHEFEVANVETDVPESGNFGWHIIFSQWCLDALCRLPGWDVEGSSHCAGLADSGATGKELR